MDQGRIDQVIEAIENEDIERAAILVREATGATQRQALEIVLTLMEGLEDAESRGVRLT